MLRQVLFDEDAFPARKREECRGTPPAPDTDGRDALTLSEARPGKRGQQSLPGILCHAVQARDRTKAENATI